MLLISLYSPSSSICFEGVRTSAMTLSEELIRMVESAKRTPVPVMEKTNLYFDLGVDSVSFIEFLLEVEKRYAITFDITEMEQCLQVNGLIALVESKVKERSGNHD